MPRDPDNRGQDASGVAPRRCCVVSPELLVELHTAIQVTSPLELACSI
jgi:hypothetical protein